MIDENRDPDLRGVRDDWCAPLPRPEMHERILRACEGELRRTGVLWRFTAVAALVLIAAFAASRIELRKHRPVNVTRALREEPQEPATPERAVTSTSRVTPPSRARSVARKAARGLDRPADRLVTRFYRLMDAPPPLGDGILVRVMVPQSTLRIAGVPVLDSQMNGSVEADVLIGEDGLARAIRFVGFK